MSEVAVLMSTYNGEKFLPEQLDSLFAQQAVSVAVHARDDGSSDQTLSMLESRLADEKHSVQAGENLRPALSFMNLVCQVPDYPFYAFADQDDIWLPGKLKRALAMLDDSTPEVPQLYFSNATNVDADGRSLGPLIATSVPPGLGNALVQCFSIGATMVFNHAARRLLTERGIPRHLTMHDWWAYLLVASLGRVVYDPEPSMLYRQHGQNVYGSVGDAEYLRRNWRKIWQAERMHEAREQALDLLSMYGSELTEQSRAALEAFTAAGIGWRAPGRAIVLPVYKQKAAGTLVAKLQWAALSC